MGGSCQQQDKCTAFWSWRGLGWMKFTWLNLIEAFQTRGWGWPVPSVPLPAYNRADREGLIHESLGAKHSSGNRSNMFRNLQNNPRIQFTRDCCYLGCSCRGTEWVLPYGPHAELFKRCNEVVFSAVAQYPLQAKQRLCIPFSTPEWLYFKVCKLSPIKSM